MNVSSLCCLRKASLTRFLRRETTPIIDVEWRRRVADGTEALRDFRPADAECLKVRYRSRRWHLLVEGVQYRIFGSLSAVPDSLMQPLNLHTRARVLMVQRLTRIKIVEPIDSLKIGEGYIYTCIILRPKCLPIYSREFTLKFECVRERIWVSQDCLSRVGFGLSGEL